MEAILDRFLRYVEIETTSNENSETQPSSQCQLTLLQMLCSELCEMGIDAQLDEFGYVMATIPANCNKKIPTIGFIAHVDTSPDALGRNITPKIVNKYKGKDILLNDNPRIYLSPKEFPELKNYIGQTLITTDGTTLLGADDKAGVAEIMTLAQYLIENPDVKHGTIKIGFTPDEEIGRGVVKFDVEKFDAQYAYTVDGGALGELEYENFNAAAAQVNISGKNIHPGYAKDKMINSQLVAMEFNNLLPQSQRPDKTENYEGFFHLTSMKGSVENSTLEYIIRDHNAQNFEQKKVLLQKIAGKLNKKYGNIIEVEIRNQYANMREKVLPHFHIVEIAEKAMKMANVKPQIQPIRGGTDGANLSFMGLPCPNIFTGGHNFHGRFEYIPLQSMEKAVDVLINICKIYATDKIIKSQKTPTLKIKLRQINSTFILKWLAIFVVTVCLFLGIRQSFYAIEQYKLFSAINSSILDNNNLQELINGDYSKIYGIDVSSYQGEINWKKVKKENIIKFVYVRASMGDAKNDDNTEKNINGARKNGLLVGMYHYFYNRGNVQEQFDNFDFYYSQYPTDLLPMLDVEAEHNKFGKAKRPPKHLCDSVAKFIELFEAKYPGVSPIIYSSQRFFNDYLSERFFDNKKWIANYNFVDTPNLKNNADWHILQYTENGTIHGINNLVDMNFLNNEHSLEELLIQK